MLADVAQQQLGHWAQGLATRFPRLVPVAAFVALLAYVGAQTLETFKACADYSDGSREYGMFPAAATSPVNCTSAIVHIHGWQGHQLTTWMNDKNGTSLFDEDMLPAALPQSCLFTYSYNGGSLGSDSFEELASALRGQLRTHLPADIPLVFVAHSAGGLVLKKMLTAGVSETAFHKRIRGILFMGTPHTGSPFADEFVGHLKKVAREVCRSPFVAEMGTKNSRELLRMHNSFTSFNLPTKYVAEGRRTDLQTFTTVFGDAGAYVKSETNIVPIDSACPIGKDHEDCYTAVGANHINLVKFSGPEDIGYQTLVGFIKRWLPEAQQDPQPTANELKAAELFRLRAEREEREAKDQRAKDEQELSQPSSGDPVHWKLTSSAYSRPNDIIIGDAGHSASFSRCTLPLTGWVVGDTPLSTGRHLWRVTVGGSMYGMHLAIVEAGKKIVHPPWDDPSFYGVGTSASNRYTAAVHSRDSGLERIKKGDVVDLLLDVDARTLIVITLRDKRMCRFSDLPKVEAGWLPLFEFSAGEPFSVEVLRPENAGKLEVLAASGDD